MSADFLASLGGPRSEGCPSDLEIDRYRLDELDATRASEVAKHIDTCEDCTARLGFETSVFEQTNELDRARFLKNVTAEGDKAKPRRWRRPLGALIAVAAAALFVVLATPEPNGSGNPDGRPNILTKGSLKLSVFRQQRTGAVEISSGSEFSAGDRIRVRIGVPEDGHVLVVGVEASGTMFTYFSNGDASIPVSAPSADLPGAAELDGSLGQEQMHAVFCKQAFSAGQLSVSGEGINMPEDCRSTRFDLEKVAR